MTALVALWFREWRRFFRQPSRLVATIGTAALLWAFLAGGFADAVNPGAVEDYALFLVPGVATMIVTFGAIFGAISLIQDRHDGFLQSALVSPASRWSIVGAKVLAVATLATAQAGLVLLAAPLLGARPDALGWFGAIAGCCLGSLGVGGLSLALAWRIDSTEGFHGVMNLVLMPMWLLSGAFFPADTAHAALAAAMAVNPLRWVTDVIRSSLMHESIPVGVWAGAIGFAAAGCAVAWGTMSARHGRPLSRHAHA